MGDNRGASDDSRFWGPVPRDWFIGGAFATYWPPKQDRPPLAARLRVRRLGSAGPLRHHAPPCRRVAAPRGRQAASRSAARSNGRKLFIHDRRLGVALRRRAPTRPGAAAWPGRWSPPRSCSTSTRLTPARRPRARRAQRLQAAHRRRRATSSTRSCCAPPPKVWVVSRCARGIDARGLHRTNLDALRDALRGVARPGVLCLSDGFPLGKDFPWPLPRRSSTATRRARRSPPRRSSRRSRATGSCTAPTRLHPGWDFARARRLLDARAPRGDPRLGVSPLHRMSFQSLAYQQLAL